MNYVTRTTCRVCGSPKLVPLFSLGEQWISNFVSKKDILTGPKAPIELVICKGCTLVQNPHTAPQELLYSRYYWYRSGVTETMRNVLNDAVATAILIADLRKGETVLDIGANDGTLLGCYSSNNPRVAVEPANNLVKECAKYCDLVINDFWPTERYTSLYVKAKIITAMGMFYDLDDPNPFIAAIKENLHREGLFLAQLMCLKNMLAIGDIGNLAHEHLEFYSLKSLQYLFGKHGLEIFDLETNNVNGESYRLYIRHKGATKPHTYGGAKRIEKAEMEEENLDNPGIYYDLEQKMKDNKLEVANFIKEEVLGKHKRVWVYGASTKGNVLLQFYELDHALIEGAADRSPEKWGKYTIGTGIPIYSEEEARKHKPDFFLVLPYAFMDEFKTREKAWLDGGGKFIVPLPKMRIVP